MAIIARGAASALGVGAAAFDVLGPGDAAPSAWSSRPPGKPFARVTACDAERSVRPRALFELGLAQVRRELDARDPGWRSKRLGVVVGTSSGGFAALERALAAGSEASAPEWSQSAYFAPLGGIARVLEREPDRLVSLYGACASSALALGLGMRWLEQERFELVIAGGYDAESDWVCAGFDSLKATSAGPPRPFRVERDGMALGEGVGLVALTRSAARAYGFIEGFAATTDAVHITAPDRTGAGLARAAQLALADAGLESHQLGLVSAHGTGTSFNDASEAAALARVFGAREQPLYLHAFKPSIGHTLGAASVLEALAALCALERGLCPASASPGTAMPELAGRVLERNEPLLLERCLKLATAFGGANAALVLALAPGLQRQRSTRTVHLAAASPASHELDLAQIADELVVAVERLPRSDMLSSLAIASAGQTLQAAGRAGLRLDRARTGVVVGSVAATIEANAELGVRILARGPEHAEPRRFPATSPNACAGHVAIAFGLGGPSHAVGAGAGAALEALLVARDWVAAGDADAMLVVAAEQTGAAARSSLERLGIPVLEQGALSVLVSTTAMGPVLDEALIERATQAAHDPENIGFRGLGALCQAASLPGFSAFGSVRPPE